ncbi:hypothetical protein DXA62_10685 [Coprobacillus sp. OF03-2AA]|nr:hypothetical protein DXA62_10685 [Coprobacillus sp. OF03-2AA]
MNKLEKKLIDQLIEQSESNYPMQNAVSDCCKEYLNNNQVNELSSFIEFYENIFEISKNKLKKYIIKKVYLLTLMKLLELLLLKIYLNAYPQMMKAF